MGVPGHVRARYTMQVRRTVKTIPPRVVDEERSPFVIVRSGERTRNAGACTSIND